MDLFTLRREAGLSRERAAEIFGRSVRTWRRWEAGQAPGYVLDLLQLIGGDLGYFGREWRGFRVARGLIFPRDLALGYGPADLFRIHWDRQIIRGLERDRRDLLDQVNALSRVAAASRCRQPARRRQAS